MVELLQMWALVEVLGIVCLPLTFTIFRNLPDRGWAFSKSLSIVITAFAVWLPLICVHFLPFSQLFVVGIALILAACGGFGFMRMHRVIVEIWRRNRSYVIATEIVFAGMLLLLGWLRTFKPDIHGFEMFMDEGFVASIMRSTHFPPNDMWFSGYSINYYYYAHYTIAMLARLLGQSPAIAFNTGIALFFGLTALNLFGVTCNIVAWGRYEYAKTQLTAETEASDRAFPGLLPPAVPYGVVSMLMGLILGNLAATQQWWQNHGTSSNFDWFAPSRVIKDTINEFPAFSFILSCFHAHVLTLAFTILCIGLAFNLFLETEGRGLNVFGAGWRRILNICVTAVALGGLFVMNGWDYPTYMGLTCVCIVVQQFLAYQARLRAALLFDIILVVVSLIALSYIFYLPFYSSFVSPSQGIGIVSQNYHSQLSDELLIYGLFIFVFVSLLIVSGIKRSGMVHAIDVIPVPIAAGAHLSSVYNDEHADFAFDLEEMAEPLAKNEQKCIESNLSQIENMPVESKSFSTDNQIVMRVIWLGMGAYLLASLVALIFFPRYATPVLGCCVAVLGAVLMLYHIRNRAQAFALLSGAAAFTLIAACEVFFLKDVFADGPDLRMNTIFKLYFQAWSLLSISSGVGLFFIWKSFRSWWVAPSSMRWVRRGIMAVWSLCLFILVLASMAYPLLAPYARYASTDESNTQPSMTTHFSLDGAAYLATCRPPDCDFVTAGDYKAIQWLNEHVQGDPVIVEGMGDDYGYNSRISTFTGLPTLMGWVGHEVQWRVNWLKQGPDKQADFDSRAASIETIYTNPDHSVVLTTMARYNVQYLYVGAFEKNKYPGVDLKRFNSFMHLIYDADGVTIFQVN